MTQANISNFKLAKATVGSPATYQDIEEVLSISGVGVNNELVNVTNFDSGSSQEYIAGLSDGSEITVECNFLDATNGVVQNELVADVDAGNTVNFQLSYTATSPDETWSFAAVCLGWELIPSPTEQNRISFTLKITGDIT